MIREITFVVMDVFDQCTIQEELESIYRMKMWERHHDLIYGD